MNTVQEQEEDEAKTIQYDSDNSLSPPEASRPRRPSAYHLNDARKLSEPKSENGKFDRKLEIPIIQETQATPKPHRRHSTLDSVLQVLRRPSVGFDAFRRGSGHVNGDNSRRASPGNAEMHNLPLRLVDNSVQRVNLGAVVPTNHVSFRRPSGIVTFNPDLMNSHQKRYIMGLLQGNSGSNSSLPGDSTTTNSKKKMKLKQCRDGNDALVTILSAFYAKFLFVIGIAFPITEVISNQVSTHYFQGFYLYLYSVSLIFMIFMYMTLLKNRAISQLLKNSLDVEDDELKRIRCKNRKNSPKRLIRYGSFYLRLGAVAFGIGSMVYSGLEFGQYFELGGDCKNPLRAVTPISRMILTLIQMQFIFLTSRQMEMFRYRGIARFGLMHMIATNLCEWFHVIIEETKHEVVHVWDHGKSHDSPDHGERRRRESDGHDIYECSRGDVIGLLVQKASPYLFPCTIEYSLICAVIMYEMWKTVKNTDDSEEDESHGLSRQLSKTSMDMDKSNNHFTVDCSNAHKGLFSGILVLVITIISLIMFSVMTKDSLDSSYVEMVYSWELLLYVLTTATVILGGWKMRFLTYKLKHRKEGIGLDNTLLVWAQAGLFIYSMFSTIACYFSIATSSPSGLITDVLNLVQGSAQTVFILDATFRRTQTNEQYKSKPGRQIITFLLVSNMALWLINTLQKSNAESRPTHSTFYGVLEWIIITHVSMPLAIFFRFHSTICLFEIWKNAYKFKNTDHTISLLGNTLN